MKTLLSIICILFAFTATAGERMIQDRTKLYSDTFSSKQEAVDAGFNMYDALANANDKQLRWKLNPVSQNIIEDSMLVKNAQVKLQEVSVARDTVNYRAIVEVHFNYKVRESSR
ncbi:acyl-CoA synthetase [Vibrio natriegens]|uniref:DUF3316 domain-containing protein n=1 Tax=Vibrio natriegens TaxID=691 RepID=UPI000803F915|nr:DUF3316 domain-containing protein [Vibrio natriegens]ANQ29362.1 acyl-CoA synthetase [Vibrio natriegens]